MAHEHYLYESISEQLRQHIRTGSYSAGERLPSVRQLSQMFGVSVNTVVQCFRQLETDGYIEIRPRSGVFVHASPPGQTQLAEILSFPLLPVEVSLSEDILHFMEPHVENDLVRLGIALPASEIMPVERVMRTLREVTRNHAQQAWDYCHPHGLESFTHQISHRSLKYPAPINHGDIVVTNGCMEAIELALRSVTRRGDTVAVETPTYYGSLVALDVLRRRALEIPTHARDGLCLYSLEQAFKRGQVAACLISANAQNPLGFCMPADRKERLVELASHYDIPIIENDVWGDTCFAGDSLPVKAWDRDGLVIYCSSFSKTLMPGMRLGWVAPGRFHKRLRELKQISSITTASAPQLLMARLLESGFYARHLEQLRQQLAEQSSAMSQAVADSFPRGTHITQPTGGCALWIGLPQHIDSRVLFTQAMAERIHIFPGNVFSAGPRHFNYLRLNTGQPVDATVRQAVYRLGELAGQLAGH